MTEKELLYLEDAINHELFMIEMLDEMEDCLNEEKLKKTVKKMKRKHEGILKMFMELM